MSKLIAVWGTPDSGKTTFATKLARSIYEEYQSILRTKEQYPVLHPTNEGQNYSEHITVGQLKKLNLYLSE